jgi:hypothetical protein
VINNHNVREWSFPFIHNQGQDAGQKNSDYLGHTPKSSSYRGHDRLTAPQNKRPPLHHILTLSKHQTFLQMPWVKGVTIGGPVGSSYVPKGQEPGLRNLIMGQEITFLPRDGAEGFPAVGSDISPTSWSSVSLSLIECTTLGLRLRLDLPEPTNKLMLQDPGQSW